MQKSLFCAFSHPDARLHPQTPLSLLVPGSLKTTYFKKPVRDMSTEWTPGKVLRVSGLTDVCGAVAAAARDFLSTLFGVFVVVVIVAVAVVVVALVTSISR